MHKLIHKVFQRLRIGISGSGTVCGFCVEKGEKQGNTEEKTTKTCNLHGGLYAPVKLNMRALYYKGVLFASACVYPANSARRGEPDGGVGFCGGGYIFFGTADFLRGSESAENGKKRASPEKTRNKFVNFF